MVAISKKYKFNNKCKTKIKKQFGGSYKSYNKFKPASNNGSHKLRIEKPKSFAITRPPTSSEPQGFIKKKSFFGTVKSVPRKVFSGLTAFKDASFSTLGRTKLGKFSKRIMPGFNTQASIAKKIQQRINKFGGDDENNPFKQAEAIAAARKNKFGHLQELEGLKKELNELTKQPANLQNPDELSVKLEDIKKREEKISDEDAKITTAQAVLKQLQTKAEAIPEGSPDKQKLLEAIAKSRDYNSRLQKRVAGKELQLMTPGSFKQDFQRKYKETSNAFRLNPFKSIGASLAPAFIRRGFQSALDGKRTKAAIIEREGRLTAANRFFNAGFKNRSKETLAKRLKEDSKVIKKIATDTKDVLLNIQDLQNSIDSLKDPVTGFPRTDPLSKVRRERLNEQINQQQVLLGALQNKGKRYSQFVEDTQKQLDAKTFRQDVKKINKIKQIQEDIPNFTSEIDKILAETGQPRRNFTNIDSLLNKITTLQDPNEIVKNISNLEIDNALTDLKTMRTNITGKFASANNDFERERLTYYLKQITDQGKNLEKLYQRTTKAENSGTLSAQAENVGRFLSKTRKASESISGKKTRINRFSVLPGAMSSARSLTKLVGRTINSSLRSIPLLSVNGERYKMPDKDKVKAAIENIEKSEIMSTKSARLTDSEKKAFKKKYGNDEVLKSLYESNPKKFNEIVANIYENNPEQKAKLIKIAFAEDLQKTKKKMEAYEEKKEINTLEKNLIKEYGYTPEIAKKEAEDQRNSRDIFRLNLNETKFPDLASKKAEVQRLRKLRLEGVAPETQESIAAKSKVEFIESAKAKLDIQVNINKDDITARKGDLENPKFKEPYEIKMAEIAIQNNNKEIEAEKIKQNQIKIEEEQKSNEANDENIKKEKAKLEVINNNLLKTGLSPEEKERLESEKIEQESKINQFEENKKVHENNIIIYTKEQENSQTVINKFNEEIKKLETTPEYTKYKNMEEELKKSEEDLAKKEENIKKLTEISEVEAKKIKIPGEETKPKIPNPAIISSPSPNTNITIKARQERIQKLQQVAVKFNEEIKSDIQKYNEAFEKNRQAIENVEKVESEKSESENEINFLNETLTNAKESKQNFTNKILLNEQKSRKLNQQNIELENKNNVESNETVKAENNKTIELNKAEIEKININTSDIQEHINKIIDPEINEYSSNIKLSTDYINKLINDIGYKNDKKSVESTEALKNTITEKLEKQKAMHEKINAADLSIVKNENGNILSVKLPYADELPEILEVKSSSTSVRPGKLDLAALQQLTKRRKNESNALLGIKKTPPPKAPKFIITFDPENHTEYDEKLDEIINSPEIRKNLEPKDIVFPEITKTNLNEITKTIVKLDEMMNKLHGDPDVDVTLETYNAIKDKYEIFLQKFKDAKNGYYEVRPDDEPDLGSGFPYSGPVFRRNPQFSFPPRSQSINNN